MPRTPWTAKAVDIIGHCSARATSRFFAVAFVGLVESFLSPEAEVFRRKGQVCLNANRSSIYLSFEFASVPHIGYKILTKSFFTGLSDPFGLVSQMSSRCLAVGGLWGKDWKLRVGNSNRRCRAHFSEDFPLHTRHTYTDIQTHNTYNCRDL